MVTTTQPVIIGMGELQVSNDPSDILTCLGLGSCIGLCVYDDATNVAGMVHIVLPSSTNAQSATVAKFADTAVPELIRRVVDLGAVRSRLWAKMAGGAQMSLSPGADSFFKTGARNAEATKSTLESLKIPLTVSNQRNWDPLRPERSGVRWRLGELPQGPVVTSASLDGLSLHLLPAS